MVQIKLSIAFILAATSIAPVLSQPLAPTDVVRSAFSRRSTDDSASLKARDGEEHHRHGGKHHHHGHHHGHKAAAAAAESTDAPSQSPDPNAGAVTPSRREYVGQLWAREGEHRHGGKRHHHHHGHKAAAAAAESTDAPSQSPDPNAGGVTPSRREYVDQLWAREGEHHHHGGKRHHHHHGHKAAAAAAESTDAPSQSPDPNAGAVTPSRREYVDQLWAREGEHHHHGGKRHHHHHHGHKAAAVAAESTDAPSQSPDPNAAAGAVTPSRREYVDQLWVREGEHHHHGGKRHHHHHGHKAAAAAAESTDAPSQSPDPNAGAGAVTPTRREYADELLERFFDEYDLD